MGTAPVQPRRPQAASSDDNALLLYDTSTWSEISHYKNPCIKRCNLAASPDLSVLVVVEADKRGLPPSSATVWDLMTGKQIRDITAGLERSEPTLMSFTPDGRLLFGVTNYVAFDVAGEWKIIDLGEHPDHPIDSFVRYREFADDGRSYLEWYFNGEKGILGSIWLIRLP